MDDVQTEPQAENDKKPKEHKLLRCARLAVKAFELKESELIYCIEEDKFYHYKEGYWQQEFEIELLDKITEWLPELNRYSNAEFENILTYIKRLTHKRLDSFNRFHLLNLQNVMLNPKDGTIEKHDPFYYSTIRIPYKYDLNSKCELWLKTIGEIFEDNIDKMAMLQEFFGYCLIPDVTQKKALLLLGQSDSGKSTILNVLRDLLGKDNCSSVPLKYLSNAQYTPMMVGKLANIDPDVGRDAANYEGDFKIITSGEPVNCNQKFVKTFDFIPICRIVLAANVFPNITDHSSAFYTRLIIIPCDRVFTEGEKDRLLSTKLKGELSGILNWALEGLKNLQLRGYFESKEFSTDAVEELSDENNPAHVFMKECIEIQPGAELVKSVLYNNYINWCRAKGIIYKLSDIRFGKEVFRKFNKVTSKKERSVSSGRPYVWKNLVYTGEAFNNEDRGTGWVE